MLREDGGFDYKKAIVESILILIREIPDAKESGLAHLCEFIEARTERNPSVCSIPPSAWHRAASEICGHTMSQVSCCYCECYINHCAA